MVAHVEFPDEAARRGFVAKLASLRGELTPGEQRILDSMAIAAFGSGESGDVEGYGWYFGEMDPVTNRPIFYDVGWAAQWIYTPWAMAYRGLQAGT